MWGLLTSGRGKHTHRQGCITDLRKAGNNLPDYTALFTVLKDVAVIPPSNDKCRADFSNMQFSAGQSAGIATGYQLDDRGTGVRVPIK
jgi:hypothetical protein